MMTPKQRLQHETDLSVAHHEFQSGLNLYALFKLRDRALGEDLVQETFLKTWKYLVRSGKIDMMKSFLYHILNNLIIDEYRKRKNASSSLDVLLDKGFEPADDGPERLFDVLDGKAAMLLIHHLPVAYQKVMRMRYVQDLTLEEISILTSQSKNTTAVKLHRGLEKLKVLYKNQQGTV